MKRDKKSRGSLLRFVVLYGLARPDAARGSRPRPAAGGVRRDQRRRPTRAAATQPAPRCRQSRMPGGSWRRVQTASVASSSAGGEPCRRSLDATGARSVRLDAGCGDVAARDRPSGTVGLGARRRPRDGATPSSLELDAARVGERLQGLDPVPVGVVEPAGPVDLQGRARAASGAAAPRWYLPVSRPRARGKNGQQPEVEALAGRRHLVLDGAVEQRVLVLHRHEARPGPRSPTSTRRPRPASRRSWSSRRRAPCPRGRGR